ncbi:MAG: FtsH protease activity modulator HflK [Bacteriovoracaceae bacterium]|nr:FtsH protease activity modulator HflK [Bacteriovoracaceae bacterium]
MNQGQPDLNYELYKLKQSFNKNKKALLPLLMAVLIAIGFFTSYYTVEPDEEAVVIRLGRYLDTTQPGLHFKIPFGIDRVIKVKTKIVHQEEFGFRSQSYNSRRTNYGSRNLDEESLMVTGDLNVAEVQWVVQYQISNPFKFLFKTSEPVRNIRDVSESILRRVVGDIMVTEVLTTGRVGIAGDAKQLMQEVLDKYDMGVLIRSIKLQDVNPPKKVQASFNDVNAAKQEQEKMINQAEQAYNKVIPEAKGKAKKLVSEAQGYAQAVVNRAEGDANRFAEIYREYIKAPNVTKKRLYLEAMEELFSKLDNVVIIDPKVKGLLPVFGKGISNEK